MVLGKLDRYVQKKKKLDYLLTPYTRIHSKWIKHLNVSEEITKILEENTGSKILDILVAIFLPIYLLGQEKPRKKTRWDYIKLIFYFSLNVKKL